LYNPYQMRPSTIDAHPQRAAIIDAILAGEKGKKIAERYGLSEMAVSRYRNVTIPTDLAISTALDQGDEIKAIALAKGREMFRRSSPDGFVTSASIAAKRLAAAVAKRDEETAQLTSIALKKKDFRGYAAVAAVAQRDDELVAKVSGLLSSGDGAVTNNNVLVIMPGVEGEFEQTDGDVIDVETGA